MNAIARTRRTCEFIRTCGEIRTYGKTSISVLAYAGAVGSCMK